MKKRMISLTLALAFILSLSLTASARWNGSIDGSVTLSYSGSSAVCSVTADANESTAKISATMTLYRMNANGSRTQVASWPLSGTGSINAKKYYSPTVSKTTYHLTVQGTVTDSSGSHTFSTYKQATCP
ncbi:MAG: hypothetical protein IKT45_01160 [Lachnospiraceae bacterium]|nr:hypothetical protein [Lachnospiraceae bacterium]